VFAKRILKFEKRINTDMETNTVPGTVVCRIRPIREDNGPITEKKLAFDYGYGHTSFKRTDFNGMRLLYSRVQFDRPFPVQMENGSPYMELYFSLAGSRSLVFSRDSSNRVDAGTHNLFYIPRGGFWLEPDDIEGEIITLQIQFTTAYFERFMQLSHPAFEGFAKNMAQQLPAALAGAAQRITPEMLGILHDIIHCEKEGVIKQLFIETCALKLLQLQLEQLITTTVMPLQKVNDKDSQRLHLVRRLIDQNPAAHHTLASLSRHTGLNEFKLKKGFKALFGTTVMGYLHTRRMAIAKRLLLETALPVSDIAEQCGYAYAQSFSTAFKKYFGSTPEGLRTNNP
jgi:AraC-like DNA-binding protein